MSCCGLEFQFLSVPTYSRLPTRSTRSTFYVPNPPSHLGYYTRRGHQQERFDSQRTFSLTMRRPWADHELALSGPWPGGDWTHSMNLVLTLRVACLLAKLSLCARTLGGLYCLYNTAWLKKMDSVSYVYISWTIHGMWMICITFERGGPKFSNTTARALA